MSNEDLPSGGEPREEVIEEVKAWEANRATYPGWVVAPERTRRHLSDHTRPWVESLLTSVQSRQPLDALRLLDELNWRLEAAMLPLDDQVADAVDRILRAVHPYPGEPVFPERPAVTLEGSPIPLSEWEKHRRRWLDLSLALLRFHREERRHLQFNDLASRLRPRLTSSGFSARWCYERCLYGLARMDDAFTRQALADWPADDDDPAWPVRRAAVLAELGELTEAFRLAEGALRRIRSSYHGLAHIPSVSREAWAMLLVYALEASSCLEAGSPLPDFRGRFEALERVRCNPWAEIGPLSELLKRDPPRPEPQWQESPGFDIGSIVAAYSSSQVTEKLPPAYQYSRMTEEGPYPPRVGMVQYAKETLGLVSGWLADNDSVRSRSLTCRLLDRNLIDRYFARPRVAIMQLDVVSDLFECAERALAQATAIVGGSVFGPDASSLRDRESTRLEAAVVMLSRLAIRLPSGQAARFLSKVLGLFQSEVVRKSLLLPMEIGKLLKAVLAAMIPADLATSLLSIVQLPVPGTPEFPVPDPIQWPSIANLLPDLIDPPQREAAPESWAARVQSLLALLHQVMPQVRGNVTVLLQRLSDLGSLTPDEQKQFAVALWANRDIASGLPPIHPYRRSVLLSLPEPTKGLAEAAFLGYLTRADLPRFRTPSIGPDGQDRPSYALLDDSDGLLIDWIIAVPATVLSTKPRRSVNPSADDLALLIQKLRAWWEEEGRPLLMGNLMSSPAFGPIADAMQMRCRLILDVLRDVILSRIPRSRQGSALVELSLALFDEFRQAGIATHAIQPALLRFRPATRAEVEECLVSGLASPQRRDYFQAVRGLHFWLSTQLRGSRRPRGYTKIPAPPDHLLQQLGINLAARRQPGLLTSIDAARVVCSDYPALATSQFINSVVLGLRYLFNEAAYRDRSDSDGLIPYLEIPIYRVATARLAYAVSRCLYAEDDVVARWLTEASSDPLPEVRAAVQGDS